MTEMKIADKDKFMPFTDNVIFSLVMRDPDICRRITEMILPDEDIGEVRVATPDNILFDEDSDFKVMVQASLDFGKNIRGVRFENGVVPICVSRLMGTPSANGSPASAGYEPTALRRRVPHAKALHS